MFGEGLSLLAISVGNTSTRFGVFEGARLMRSGRGLNAGFVPLRDQIEAAGRELPSDGGASAVVVASVNEPFAAKLLEELKPRLGHEVYRIGTDLEVPIRLALDEGARPGQDRLLNALAAFDSLKQACVIVDAGTAVTVDFVDGEGVFQGGAILPGAAMMLRALHGQTSALPEVPLAAPGPEVFGKNTAQSMLNGVFFGIRGAVRQLVERYAEAYEAYPSVIATGGDSPLLFDGEELMDRLVPDLTIRGIEAACRLQVEE